MCDRYGVTEAHAALMQRHGAEPVYPHHKTYLPRKNTPRIGGVIHRRELGCRSQEKIHPGAAASHQTDNTCSRSTRYRVH